VFEAARRAVRYELGLYRSLYRWLIRRPFVPVGDHGVPYVATISVILWGFVMAAAIELVAVHFLVTWAGARLVLDILGAWGMVWILGVVASFHVYPHVVGPAGLRVRRGASVDVWVPWDAVASITMRERSHERSRAVQVDGATGRVVITSRTNVDVLLARPISVRGRAVTELGLLADDPKALVSKARRFLAETGRLDAAVSPRTHAGGVVPGGEAG